MTRAERTGRGRGRWAGRLALPALIAVVWAWQADDPGVGAPVGAQEITTAGTRLVLSHAFYGSTPTLAWSPDGRRLAFNAAYEYYGYETQLAAHRSELGLWVYERDGESVRQLVGEQRYHPAWIGRDQTAQIATACSPYEDCTEGLYLTDLTGADRRLLDVSAYHTRSGRDGRVVFFNGFRGSTDWNRYDPATGARETGLSANCSWEPPAELVTDQCVQSVGDVAVAADASGLYVSAGGRAPIQLDTLPAYHFSSSAWDCRESHSGPVAPCLSPDARQVAYVAHGEDGLILRVHELPEASELAAASGTGTGGLGMPGAGPEGGAFGLGVPGAGPSSGAVERHDATPRPMASRVTPATAEQGARSYLAFDIYGDTTSLAWSPDGRRLAFNGAFQSSGYLAGDLGYDAIVDELGLFVADVGAQTVTRVVPQQRYHPAWVDDDSVASACSDWDACEAGLALTDLSGATRRVRSSGVMTTSPASDGRVLYYNPEASTWGVYDPAADRFEPSVSSACLWEPPAELVDTQCRDQVGDVRAWIQRGLGLFVQVGDGEPVRLDPARPWIYEGYAWGCMREDHSGPVGPCVSSDGRHVAYVAQGMTGLSVHVHEVPR